MKQKMYTPFSNGTEATDWMCENCDMCRRAYVPKDENDYPDFDETKKLVERGKECEMKFHLDYGFVIGEIPDYIAQKIGKGDKYGLKQTCLSFIEKNNRLSGLNGDNDDKPIDIVPDNQLCLPFIMDEIIGNQKAKETVKL